MRRILVGLGAVLCGVSLAAAQTTTTTAAPTSSTTIATSTSTSSMTSTSASGSSSTSTSLSTTTSTSATTVTIPRCGTADASATPRGCARSCKSEGGSKEECRQGCCSSYFDALVEPCNAFGDCDDGAWDDFVDQWKKANDFYKSCLRSDEDVEPSIAIAFQRYNLPDSCREYVGGCKVTALRHVYQCADAERCVTCCRTTLRRWRHAIAADLRRQSSRRCPKAIRCLRRGSRKAEACRNACRRAPTCGQAAVHECLASRQNGREVLRCYAKCADKCSNREAYPLCIQACNGLKECAAFETCVDFAASTTVTTTSGGTAFAARANGGACLVRDDRGCEATITTTSTTTSSSTVTTTSTSSTTSSTV